MSVDVFGRQLEKSGTVSNRGPPGVGFKITAEGQYDMDNKRLVNLSDPVDQNDAATVKIMQNAIQQEVRLVYQVTAALRSDVDDTTIMIQSLEARFRENSKNYLINAETVQDLATRNAQLISHIDERLRTSERAGEQLRERIFALENER